MSERQATEDTQRLLKYFDIYRDLEDEVDNYAQDEGSQTNNASRRYVKHGKQYFAFKRAGVYDKPELTGRGQRWELVKKAELKA